MTNTQFTNNQWVRYNDLLISAVTLGVIGAILVAIGFSWGMQGISSFVVETETGVAFIEGGMKDGTFKGPILSAFGLLFVVLAKEAYVISRQYRERVSDGQE